MEHVQLIPGDSYVNGVETNLVCFNKSGGNENLLLTVHQHDGNDVTRIRSIVAHTQPHTDTQSLSMVKFHMGRVHFPTTI